MSADAAADVTQRRLNHSIPRMYIRTGDTMKLGKLGVESNIALNHWTGSHITHI